MANSSEKEKVQEKYGVNMRSTKQEIYDALIAASNAIAKQGNIQLPQEEATQKENEKIVKSAESDVMLGVFSKEYTERFESLQKAIQIEQQKLQELYDVDDSLANMAVVIDAQRQLRAKFDNENADIKEEVKQHVRDCEKQKKVLDEEVQEYKTQLEKQREREQEEYEYNLQISHRNSKDRLDAELNGIMKQIDEQQAKLNEINAEIAHYDALEENAENFPARLEAEYNRGVEEGKRAAENSNKFASAIAKKDAEHEKAMLEQELTILKADNRDKQEHIYKLEEKLNDAYSQINELAKRTAETSGSIKVIGGDSSKK